MNYADFIKKEGTIKMAIFMYEIFMHDFRDLFLFENHFCTK